ncbi:SPIT2 inhibitor, partial [Nothocercus nigrocapillus]|nr:SPIT2 inhibitor [Nothocercus nigrocapillus]
WWFNASSAACQPFVFGGCDGNGNNFPTERQCQESCAPGAESCLAPRATGPCRAAFARWYYSAAEGACKRFVYGGCRGNRNNYAREDECWRRC